jgi:hypothetical protein
VFVALNPGALPARPRSPADLHEWVRREEQYAILGANVVVASTCSTTNTTFIASTEGTWRWQVTYSGDANNDGSTSACGVERFMITNQ